MTRIKVKELIWNEWNMEHIKKHHVSQEEVAELAQNIFIHKRAKLGRYVIIGRVSARILSVFIKRKGIGVYYVVTARDAAKKERRMVYEKEKNRMPNFNKMTYKEEANWWDTHDMGDYLDELEDVDLVVDLQKPKDETLVLRLQRDAKDKLNRIAKKKGISASSLARMWLAEKLRSPSL